MEDFPSRPSLEFFHAQPALEPQTQTTHYSRAFNNNTEKLCESWKSARPNGPAARVASYWKKRSRTVGMGRIISNGVDQQRRMLASEASQSPGVCGGGFHTPHPQHARQGEPERDNIIPPTKSTIKNKGKKLTPEEGAALAWGWGTSRPLFQI
jgi:hypothetical protein